MLQTGGSYARVNITVKGPVQGLSQIQMVVFTICKRTECNLGILVYWICYTGNPFGWKSNIKYFLIVKNSGS
jgi:hypothetical protein